MKKSSLSIFSILFCSFILFTGCENFLNGADLKENLDKTISYAKAKSFDIKIETTARTGKILPDGYRNSKVSDSFEIEFTLNDGYEFDKFIVYDSKNKVLLGNDVIKFENLNRDFTTYTVTATVLKEVEGLVIKPVCTKIEDDTPPVFVRDIKVSSSKANYDSGKYLSLDDFSDWSVPGNENQYYKNHASHLYISVDAYEADSELSLYVTETIIKDTNGDDVNKKSSKILTGIFNSSDYENFKAEIPYSFSSVDDGLVKLEFTLNDGSNFSETKTVYCIKDTKSDFNLAGINFYNETCAPEAGVAERNQAVRNVMLAVPAFSETWFKNSSITCNSKPKLYFSYGSDSENLYKTVEIPYSGSAQTLEFKNYLQDIPENKDTYIELSLKDDCDNFKTISGIIYAKPEPAGYTVHKNIALPYYAVVINNLLYFDVDPSIDYSTDYFLSKDEAGTSFDNNASTKIKTGYSHEFHDYTDVSIVLNLCFQNYRNNLKGFVSSPISIKKGKNAPVSSGYIDVMDKSIQVPAISNFTQTSDGPSTGTYTYSITLSAPADFKTYDNLYFVNISNNWNDQFNFCVPFEKNSLKAEVSTVYIDEEYYPARFALIATKNNGDFNRIDFKTDNYGFNKQKEYNKEPRVLAGEIDNIRQIIPVRFEFDLYDQPGEQYEKGKEYEYTMNLYYKMVESDWDTVKRPAEEIKKWPAFEPRKYTCKYIEEDYEANIYDPGWYCDTLEYCFKDFSDGDYVIAAETEDHLGNYTCKVIFTLSKKYVPKLELTSYTPDEITFSGVKPDKSHWAFDYRFKIFNAVNNTWGQEKGSSSRTELRNKYDIYKFILSRTQRSSEKSEYSIYNIDAAIKDCFIKVYLDDYKYWGDDSEIQELNIPVPMYYYIPDGTTFTDLNCDVKNYVEAANGYLIYYDRPVYIHTICSKINYKNDADKWEKMCTDEQKIQPKVIKSPTGIGQYKVDTSNIDSGNYYVTIIHFADGDTLITPVKYKY